jgi:DNA-binding IclR family transcriptional regulator
VVRAVAVLDVLASAEAAEMNLSDIARAIGVPKSSTASICAALENGGLLTRSETGYALGRRLVEFGGAYLSRRDRVREFYTACAGSELLRVETVRLWAHAGVDAICLARYDGHPAVRLTTNIGDRVPSSVSAAGKAMLAQYDDHEVRQFYAALRALPRLTVRSHSTLDELLADIGEVRRRGFAVEEEEQAQNVIELARAVPTRGARSAVMAVSVTQHTSTITDRLREALVAELGAVASALGNPMQVS